MRPGKGIFVIDDNFVKHLINVIVGLGGGGRQEIKSIKNQQLFFIVIIKMRDVPFRRSTRAPKQLDAISGKTMFNSFYHRHTIIKIKI